MNASSAVMAAQYVAAAAGVGVAAWWVRRVRFGADPLGPRPTGSLPATGTALLVALPAWFVLGATLAGVADRAGLSYAELLTMSSIVHAVIGAALLPFVRRDAPQPVLPRGRLAAAGLLGGLATYGLVGVAGKAIELIYGLAGETVPTQDVVAVAAGAKGLEWAGMFVGAGVLAPFGEEIFFRGALLPALARQTSPARAIWLQAMVFGLVHVYAAPLIVWPLAIPLALIGAINGWLYVRTGSLPVAFLVHLVFNVLTLTFLALA